MRVGTLAYHLTFKASERLTLETPLTMQAVSIQVKSLVCFCGTGMVGSFCTSNLFKIAIHSPKETERSKSNMYFSIKRVH